MCTRFRWIYRGLVLVLIDIPIEGIDWLTPDFIGYFCIALACRQWSPACGQAAILSFMMGFLSFLKLTQFDTNVMGVALLPAGVTLAAELLLVFLLCTGVLQIARTCGDRSLMGKANYRRYFFLASAVVIWSLSWFNLTNLYLIVGVFLIGWIITAIYLVLNLMWIAGDALDQTQLQGAS